MKDSFFFPPADKLNRIAMVYQKKDGKLIPAGDDILGGDPALLRRGARYPAPEWGLYSTAADLDSGISNDAERRHHAGSAISVARRRRVDDHARDRRSSPRERAGSGEADTP